MTTTFDRLLQGLPAYFDRDPYREPGLSLSYDGTGASVTVLHDVLTLYTRGGTAGSVTLMFPLAGKSLTALTTALAAIPGFTANVVGDGSVTALSLIETEDQNILERPRVDRYSSMLWNLLMVEASSLMSAQANAEAGLRNMSIRTAEGPWVDLWGEEYYGGVYRKPGESDRDYAARVIKEVLRSRLNGKALELIVEEECDVETTVTNLHDLAWVVSVTNFGYLVGRKYARTTFEVAITGVCEDLAWLIERNRPAGTFPFLRISPYSGLQIPISFTPSRAGAITPRSERQIHLTAALINDYVILVPTAVLGSGAAAIFTLGGASNLGGGHTLGDPLPGMSINDVWSTPV